MAALVAKTATQGFFLAHEVLRKSNDTGFSISREWSRLPGGLITIAA
jgi:hypothetical protein